jgi:hypothetical protein
LYIYTQSVKPKFLYHLNQLLMKHNYLLLSYNSTLKKYQKYFFRLQRNIKSGNFLKLSAGRKNFLLRKVEELRAKLVSMQPRLAGTVAATSLLLALSAPQAEAQFSLNTSKNPFVGSANTTLIPFASTYGSSSSPIFADVDGDGDKDAIVGGNAAAEYFKNTGTPTAPVYTAQTGTNNPFAALQASPYNEISMADLDNDGDLDLIVGAYDYTPTQQIYYFKNTGTASAPVFVKQMGANNPIPVFTANPTAVWASPALVDIDGDGDQDIFAGFGSYYGVNTTFFKNTGTASAPAFSEQVPTANPLAIAIGVGSGYVVPSFVDIDGDGDYDAVVSNFTDSFSYYKNTGTASAAIFTLQTGTNSPFGSFKTGVYFLKSSFADIDGDGDQDMVVGDNSGQVSYYKNTGTATAPAFDFSSPGVTGKYTRPAFADIDGDGDQDAVFGSQNGGLLYYKNNGPASAPVYVNVTGTYSPLNVTSGYTFTAPAFSDIDGDGDLDLMLGNLYGTFIYYKNTGVCHKCPVYTLQSGTNNPLDGQNVGYASTPAFADLDNDGDKDLVSGSYTSGMYYFMNTGTVSAPVFTMQTGTYNPVGITTSDTLSTPTFVNFDGDADMDMLVGTFHNGMLYFANTGTSSAPVFTAQTGTNNPFAVIMNNGVAPAFDDIDGDTDLDLFVGSGNSTITLYENTTLNPVVTSVFTPVSATFSGGVAAYPNPVKDVLNFSLNDGIGSAMKVSVLNMAGSEILSQNFDNNGSVMNINVSELNNGMYILRLNSDSKISVVKFVKQ